MSVTTVTSTSSALRDAGSTSWVNGLVGSRTGRRLLAGAAVGYLGAWLLALSVDPSGATVTATGSQALASLQGHLAASAVQYLAAEVVAGLALVVVMLGVAGSSAGYSRPVSRVVAACAIVAGAVSVPQGALGLWLTTVVAPAGGHRPGRPGLPGDHAGRRTEDRPRSVSHGGGPAGATWGISSVVDRAGRGAGCHGRPVRGGLPVPRGLAGCGGLLLAPGAAGLGRRVWAVRARPRTEGLTRWQAPA